MRRHDGGRGRDQRGGGAAVADSGQVDLWAATSAPAMAAAMVAGKGDDGSRPADEGGDGDRQPDAPPLGAPVDASAEAPPALLMAGQERDVAPAVATSAPGGRDARAGAADHTPATARGASDASRCGSAQTAEADPVRVDPVGADQAGADPVSTHLVSAHPARHHAPRRAPPAAPYTGRVWHPGLGCEVGIPRRLGPAGRYLPESLALVAVIAAATDAGALDAQARAWLVDARVAPPGVVPDGDASGHRGSDAVPPWAHSIVAALARVPDLTAALAAAGHAHGWYDAHRAAGALDDEAILALVVGLHELRGAQGQQSAGHMAYLTHAALAAATTGIVLWRALDQRARARAQAVVRGWPESGAALAHRSDRAVRAALRAIDDDPATALNGAGRFAGCAETLLARYAGAAALTQEAGWRAWWDARATTSDAA